jgi:hypothetical protein
LHNDLPDRSTVVAQIALCWYIEMEFKALHASRPERTVHPISDRVAYDRA